MKKLTLPLVAAFGLMAAVAMAHDGGNRKAKAHTEAGTVASYQAGVLTLTLADGSALKGKVTRGTDIECKHAPVVAPTETTTTTTPTTTTPTTTTATARAAKRGHDDDDDGDRRGSRGRGHDDDDREDCDEADLTAGTVVHSAALKVSGSGSTFKDVELVK